MKFQQQLEQCLTSGGVFLTSGGEGERNVMTMGWGMTGVMWGKPVFLAPVRTSRHTFDLIQKTGCYAVCIPKSDRKKELAVCGSKSGRDADKFALTGLKALPCRQIDAPAVADCLVIECKVAYQTTLEKSALPADIRERWYQKNDLHTLMIGEIVDEYEL